MEETNLVTPPSKPTYPQSTTKKPEVNPVYIVILYPIFTTCTSLSPSYHLFLILNPTPPHAASPSSSREKETYKNLILNIILRNTLWKPTRQKHINDILENALVRLLGYLHIMQLISKLPPQQQHPNKEYFCTPPPLPPH